VRSWKINWLNVIHSMMREIYYGEFRLVLIQHIREVDAVNPAYQSTEWFLLRYLQRIVKATEPPASNSRVENSIRALVRFYVDMIDERSELGERCRMINEEYRKALRAHKEQNGRHHK
jgi:hypothetical protein